MTTYDLRPATYELRVLNTDFFQHIHVFGAPGSGATTLGKALAERLGFSHFDADDYYWFTGDALPYRRKRNPEHRRKLMQSDLDKTERWVISGAVCGWGDVFIPAFDAVIYLWLPVETRLARIRERETIRYGAERLAPGGDLNEVFEKFLNWAASYDEKTGNLRSRAGELHWLEKLACPVFKIEYDAPLNVLIKNILKSLPSAHGTYRKS